MATHANSTPAPERTLLREAAAPGRLLPAEELAEIRLLVVSAQMATSALASPDRAALSVLLDVVACRMVALIDALEGCRDA